MPRRKESTVLRDTSILNIHIALSVRYPNFLHIHAAFKRVARNRRLAIARTISETTMMKRQRRETHPRGRRRDPRFDSSRHRGSWIACSDVEMSNVSRSILTRGLATHRH